MIFLYYILSMYNKRQCDPHLSPRINDLNKLDTTLHENAFTYIGFNFSGKMFYERRFPLIYSFVKKKLHHSKIVAPPYPREHDMNKNLNLNYLIKFSH